jgi:excisionase family DNA binding protein
MNQKVQFYTIEEVSKILGVTYHVVYKWIKLGKLPKFQIGKKSSIRIPADAIEKIIQGGEREK